MDHKVQHVLKQLNRRNKNKSENIDYHHHTKTQNSGRNNPSKNTQKRKIDSTVLNFCLSRPLPLTCRQSSQKYDKIIKQFKVKLDLHEEAAKNQKDGLQSLRRKNGSNQYPKRYTRLPHLHLNKQGKTISNVQILDCQQDLHGKLQQNRHGLQQQDSQTDINQIDQSVLIKTFKKISDERKRNINKYKINRIRETQDSGQGMEIKKLKLSQKQSYLKQNLNQTYAIKRYRKRLNKQLRNLLLNIVQYYDSRSIDLTNYQNCNQNQIQCDQYSDRFNLDNTFLKKGKGGRHTKLTQTIKHAFKVQTKHKAKRSKMLQTGMKISNQEQCQQKYGCIPSVFIKLIQHKNASLVT